jgi:phage major head subunit gpT-like protein
MLITTATLTALAQGFNAAFIRGFDGPGVPPMYEQVAMTINSSTDAENYGWMKDLPGVREWIGPRVYNNLEATGAQIRNRKWEHTISVGRDQIEDDRLGIFANAFAMQGEVVRRHPDDLVWGLLSEGFTQKGFDQQPFFSATHTGYTREGSEAVWSNAGTGTGPAWYLMDLSRAYMKPMVFQMRKAPQFVSRTRPDDPIVFDMDEYAFGADARYGVGFGFHQLAFGSRQALDADHYAQARLTLSTQYRPDGSPLGVKPTHLIVGPSLEAAALSILQKERLDGGEDNIWKGTAQLLVVPWLE